jgi:hypothetical protein
MGSGITNYTVNLWIQQSRNLYSDWVITAGFSSSDTLSQIQRISRNAASGQRAQLLNWDEIYIKQVLNNILVINNGGSTNWQAQMSYDSSGSPNIARIKSLVIDISTTQQIVIQSGSVTTQPRSLTSLAQSGTTSIIATSFSASTPGSSTIKIKVNMIAQGVHAVYSTTININ